MSNIINGTDLMKQYNISERDLLYYVQKGYLKPYNDINAPVPRPGSVTEDEIKWLKLAKDQLESQLINLDMEGRQAFASLLGDDDENDREKILQKIENIEDRLSRFKSQRHDPYNWKNIGLPSNKTELRLFLESLSQYYFRKDEIEKLANSKGLTKVFGVSGKVIDNSNRKNLKQSQIDKMAVRDIAEKKWEIEPTATIASMIRDKDIQEAGAKNYKENTVRNWINDLCINRSPGRRPNKA